MSVKIVQSDGRNRKQIKRATNRNMQQLEIHRRKNGWEGAIIGGVI